MVQKWIVLVWNHSFNIWIWWGRWGPGLATWRLPPWASTLDRPITVLHEHGQVYQFNAEGSKKDLFLFYQTCGHYECLKTTPEAALALRAKSSPGKTAGGRQNKGGGKKAGPRSIFQASQGSLGGHTVASRSNAALRCQGGGTKTSDEQSLEVLPPILENVSMMKLLLGVARLLISILKVLEPWGGKRPRPARSFLRIRLGKDW